MFCNLSYRISNAIREDQTVLTACNVLADQKRIPSDDVIEDLADLMTVRVHYRRKKDLTRMEQYLLGIAYITQETVNEHREKFRVKYGLSYQQSQSLSDDIVTEFLAKNKSPREVVWEAIRPILMKLLTGWLEKICGRLLGSSFTLPMLPWST